MILGIPINGAFLLVVAGAVSVVSRMIGAEDGLDRILGTLTAPCAEVCPDCCDEVLFDGSCSCPHLQPLLLPASARAAHR